MSKKIFVLMVNDPDKYVISYTHRAFGTKETLCKYIKEMREKGYLTGFEPKNDHSFANIPGLDFSAVGTFHGKNGFSTGAWIDTLDYDE